MLEIIGSRNNSCKMLSRNFAKLQLQNIKLKLMILGCGNAKKDQQLNVHTSTISDK